MRRSRLTQCKVRKRDSRLSDAGKKMRYGFMVSELTGEVDNLQSVRDDGMPHTEVCGWSYAKWFDTPEERDKIKAYTIDQIRQIRQVKK